MTSTFFSTTLRFRTTSGTGVAFWNEPFFYRSGVSTSWFKNRSLPAPLTIYLRCKSAWTTTRGRCRRSFGTILPLLHYSSSQNADYLPTSEFQRVQLIESETLLRGQFGNFLLTG